MNSVQQAMFDGAMGAAYRLVMEQRFEDALDVLNPLAKISPGDIDVKNLINKVYERKAVSPKGVYIKLEDETCDNAKIRSTTLVLNRMESLLMLYSILNRLSDWGFLSKDDTGKLDAIVAEAWDRFGEMEKRYLVSGKWTRE